jgi:hypothetical protein
MTSPAIIFPVDFDESIKCHIDLQDLLYPELDWNNSGTGRTDKHTVIVFLNPSKVLNLIDPNKVKFFNIGKMNNIIREIKSSTFWIPPIQFDGHVDEEYSFTLPNGSHRTILMHRSDIQSAPYVTCDRMAESLLNRFGSGNINKLFDLTDINYPIHF